MSAKNENIAGPAAFLSAIVTVSKIWEAMMQDTKMSDKKGQRMPPESNSGR